MSSPSPARGPGARLLAHLDWWLRPGLKHEYGGPFNDQRGRALLCEQIAASGPVEAVVETGTYRGTTTLFLARAFGAPVHSVEVVPRWHHYARLRTRHEPRIRLAVGDSRAFLAALATDPDVPKRDVFFYLDAHRPGDVPLLDELALLMRSWRDSVVMIDDFEVPGDPGYRFDDFGPGFTADLLPPRSLMRRFYPAIPSAEETGHRRGCVVLAMRGPWVERLSRIPALREDAGPA
ncbi:MAG TPA: class I SAM-dependent methyltransferase [Longimicrobiales bacterium]|nr:class I SAM-dependent methyltransferase [Longimicrobiales bacterium]